MGGEQDRIDELALAEMGESPALTDWELEAIRVDAILSELKRTITRLDSMIERSKYYSEEPTRKQLQSLRSDLQAIVRNYGP